ncbi:MAG: hypothetical protein V4544_07370 [Pseudomonadota bacterium]
MEKEEKVDIPLMISQRAEHFIEMKEQLPLETSKQMMDVLIKLLSFPETNSDYQNQCSEMAAYFRVDFTAHDLHNQKRILLFSLIKTYLFGDMSAIAANELLRDLDLHKLTVEEHKKDLAKIEEYF